MKVGLQLYAMRTEEERDFPGLLKQPDTIRVKDVAERPVALGKGNVDVAANIRAAKQAGIEWFIVEQDGSPETKATFEDLENNLAFVRGC